VILQDERGNDPKLDLDKTTQAFPINFSCETVRNALNPLAYRVAWREPRGTARQS
jgi:hypothetical protein